MRLIVSGGAGFIGSNLINYWMERYPAHNIINIDKLSYAADISYLSEVQDKKNYSFIKADLGDRQLIKSIIHDYKPDAVLHLAAESHVDNSITGPEAFVMVNVVATFNLLEECRLYWTKSNALSSNRFLHVSTDEVYGTLGSTGAFTEETPYSPSSPYSATKAGSDHIVKAYHRTYGMNTVITNCSNNFGPHQHAEKLIPTVIRKALAGENIPVYGNGTNVRDWLFVRDHCWAIDCVFHKGRPGESYNIGGRNEWSNIDIINKVCNILNQEVGNGLDGDYKNQITFVTDRLGHDFRYAIDNRKIVTELGWRASDNFELILRETVLWYVNRWGGN